MKNLPSSWIPAFGLLVLGSAIALVWMVSRPYEVNMDDFVTTVSGAIDQENESLNAIFADPPGLLRDADVQNLHDAEKTVFMNTECRPQDVRTDDRAVLGQAVQDYVDITLPCKILNSTILLKFKAAQVAFEVVADNLQYVADHCADPGYTAGQQNRLTCDRSFNLSDPRVTNEPKDYQAFIAALQSAITYGRHESRPSPLPLPQAQPIAAPAGGGQ